MASCQCGAPIVWARPLGGGALLSLDPHAAAYSGPGRFRVVDFDSPWLVEPVDAQAPDAAHADHRLSCPLVSPADRRRIELGLGTGDDDAAAHDRPAEGE